jgi:hypothetical protein
MVARSSRRRVQLALSTMVAVVLASCGGGGGSTDPAATPTAETPTATTPPATTPAATTPTDTTPVATTPPATTPAATPAATTPPVTTPSSSLGVTPATELSPGEFMVNPGATWKPFTTSTDANVGAVVSIDLSRLVPTGTQVAGAVFEVRVLGTYDQTSRATTPTLSQDVAATLVDSAGTVLALPTGWPLALAAQSQCGTRDLGTDPFANDFLIPASQAARFTAPASVVGLRLSVDDCYFSDNTVTESNRLRVSVKHVPGG